MKLRAKKGVKNEVGGLGEEITCQYLKNKGFSILDTNYLKKWGEIDVIAKYDDVVHFVEVKTVSHSSRLDLEQAIAEGNWRPEENVHHSKLKKLARTIETWILEQNWQGAYQIDVAAVRIVSSEQYASVKYLENILVE